MHEVIRVPDAFTPKGRVIVRGYRAGAIAAVAPYASALMRCHRHLRITTGQEAEYEDFRAKMLHRIAELNKHIDDIFARYALGIESATDNLIMTGSLRGRDLLVQYLIGGTTYTGGINYGALGTGSTTPAASDTRLTAEVARVVPSTIIDVSNNQVQLQCYFPDANLSNGTYPEAGTFMNGTATLNSGQIFNHALLGTAFVKTAGVDTTLQVNITLN